MGVVREKNNTVVSLALMEHREKNLGSRPNLYLWGVYKFSNVSRNVVRCVVHEAVVDTNVVKNVGGLTGSNSAPRSQKS